jgi:hypothetical protein
MPARPTVPERLPRVLFVLGLLLASALLLLVSASPWIDDGVPRPHGAARVVAVFARDGALRRTALASAAGLTVAAFVFFRPSSGRRTGPSAAPARSTPPPVVGA